MRKIKLIHVGLGGWGFDWAQHIYPGNSDVEPVAYVTNTQNRPKSSGKIIPEITPIRTGTGFFVSTEAGLQPLFNRRSSALS